MRPIHYSTIGMPVDPRNPVDTGLLPALATAVPGTEVPWRM